MDVPGGFRFTSVLLNTQAGFVVNIWNGLPIINEQAWFLIHITAGRASTPGRGSPGRNPKPQASLEKHQAAPQVVVRRAQVNEFGLSPPCPLPESEPTLCFFTIFEAEFSCAYCSLGGTNLLREEGTL